MTKKKTTKRALLMSALSLMMCVTMFVGSTFAWFTDEVTSGNNVVKSGNLDLKLSYKPYGAKNTEWTEVEADTVVFGKDALYEPGYTEAVWLKVENIGSLAFKYDLALNVENEKAGTNKDGEKFNLSDYLEVKYLNTTSTSMESGFYTTRESLNSFNFGGVANSGVTSFKDDIAVIKNGTAFSKDDTAMAGFDSSYVLVIISMPTTVRNEANHNGVDIPEINFTLTAVATQLVHEEDSFDNQYDVNAPEMYTVNDVKYETAAAALEAAKDGDKVYFSSLSEPIVIDKKIDLTIENTNIAATEGVNGITVNKSVTITAEGYNSVVGGKKADGIHVAENVTLTLTGKGTLIAKGNGGSETQEEYNAGMGGSGIDVNGTIVVDGLASLIAEGYGKHAFGIGGATNSITINDSTIKYAKGGMVDSKIGANYGKGDKEAGAAIGSNTDGAVIDIINSTIVKAEGGSKAAGIGAMYHTGVNVNIIDSDVTAYGGSSSAGIGGSRVEAHKKADGHSDVQMAAEAITVNIKNSIVNAVGGDFAAGIGSGYDTYCHPFSESDKLWSAPATTVTIDASSDISAQGGWLGAGIGTGHNAVNFVGDIACDTSKVKAGNSEDPTSDPFNCCWGMPTTIAQDVGLGVYNIKNFHGEVVTINSAEELLALGGTAINGNYVLTADIDMDAEEMESMIVSSGATVNFFGNGHTISNLDLGAANNSGMTGSGNEVAGLFDLSAPATTVSLTVNDLIIKDATVACSGYAAAIVGYNPNGGTVITLNNVDVDGAKITSDSVAALVAYTTGSVNLTNCGVSGLELTGEAGRPEKVGAFIGTANTASCVVTVNNCTNNTDYTVYGRVINGATYNK